MNAGWKMLFAFLGGAAVGAGALAALNRGKWDFGYMKPIATNLMSKTMDLKDAVMAKVDAVREDMEDMAAEARDKADQRKAPQAEKPASQG